MGGCRRSSVSFTVLGLFLVLSGVAAGELQAATDAGEPRSMRDFDCGLRPREEVLAEIAADRAAGRGRPVDELLQMFSPPAEGVGGTSTLQTTCLSSGQVFPYEDTDSILTTGFSGAQLFVLFAEAANALVAAHGDRFDFISFFLNFEPAHQIGAAFY